MGAMLDSKRARGKDPLIMILLIDNYDSFTFNLYHFLGDLGEVVEVRRNDSLSVDEALALRPEAIVLSPGPCTPNEAGICLDLIAAAAAERMPLLGVCLGHQSIGQAFGGRVVRAPEPVHGKVWEVNHADLKATHTFGEDRAVCPTVRKWTATVRGNSTNYTFPKHSLTILKLRVR